MKKLIIFLLSLICFLAAAGYSVYRIYDGTFLTENVLWLGIDLLVSALFGAALVLFVTRRKDQRIKFLNERLKQMIDVSVNVNKAGDHVFKELPVGILIYDSNDVVKWANQSAKDSFGPNTLENKLVNIDEQLLSLVSGNYQTLTFKHGNHFYLAEAHKETRTIYLFDVTEKEETLKRYDDRITTLGVINIDNLELETKSFEFSDLAKLRGSLLESINVWVSRFNGFIHPYEDDSLIFMCDKQNLKRMIDDKFSVLESIRDVGQSNGIHITLSIGIACFDSNYEELGNLAFQAADLAEKRGGDQAVVNMEGEKIQYFGGKTNALEKNSFLEARSNALQLKDIVEDYNDVVIMIHKNADADAFGSAIGMLKMILSSKRNVKVYLDDQLIDKTASKAYETLKAYDPELSSYFVNESQINVDNSSLLVVLDTQTSKIIMNEELYSKFKHVCVIDHHRTAEDSFGDIEYSYIDTTASSTVELVTSMLQFYQKRPIVLSPNEATLMLLGIVVDTNNFTFRCGPQTFEAASILKEYGADMISVRKLLRDNYSFQQELAEYYKASEVILNRFIICALPEEKEISERASLAKISDSLLNIDNIEASFTLAYFESDGEKEVCISARSFGDVNVQIIMEEMGGGGHLNGAAAQIKGRTLSEVKEEIISIINREYEEGEENMKVILLEDVKGRGKKNQVIDVAAGYGNYLVTNKKAIIATDQSLAKLKEDLHNEEIEAQEHKRTMQHIKAEIEEHKVNIYIKVGSDGKLFGHVTNKQVSEELERQTGIHLDKKKISFPTEITGIGVYTALIDLHPEVKANLEINVLED